MLRSYFNIAYRNILNNKGYSFINVFGLSIGIACFLLLLNYIRYELSFDTFHPDVARTYRVDRDLDEGPSGSTAPPLAYTLKTNFPEVEDVMRINTPGDFIIRFADRSNRVIAFNEKRVYAADSNFFSFFGFRLKEGDPRTALSGPDKVVISEETANKVFGETSALGKILLLGDKRTALEVTGVTYSLPRNTHFHFDYLLSMDTNPNVRERDWSWVWTQVVTYVRLKPDADLHSFERKLAQLADKVIRPAFEARGMDYESSLKGKGRWKFYLTPLADIHLRSGDNRVGAVGDIKYVYAFAIIAVFVLLIAAINFINLSTARGTKRAREVGVKKTMGAQRRTLVVQFQIESIFLASLATGLALVMIEILQIVIIRIVGIDTPFTLLDRSQMWWIVPSIPLVIGFLAGLYPSFYLTSFQPMQVLKGKIASGMGNASLRNALVIVQFTISIALIAGSLIVYQQIRFIGSTPLGFDRENILLIQHADKLGSYLKAFRDEVESYPGVYQAGIAMEPPGGDVWSDGFVGQNSDVNVDIAIIKIDPHYFSTLDFQLVAGRAFDKDRVSDKNAVIPNETTVHLFGWTPEQAIGQHLVYPGNDNTRHEIIGVMKDFHYQSLHESISPVMYCDLESDIWGDWRVLAIKFDPSQIAGIIQRINKRWNSILNDTPFDYSFLDQDLAGEYDTEQRLGALFGIFTGLSILIAIIGLIGLVSYSAEVRKKEIGIRKVFGASTARIILLMNSQYVRLTIWALAFAVPLSWWAMLRWLDSFEYKIEITPFTFVVAGVVQLLLAALSVGYLSFLAASANPSKVLKEE